MYPGRADRDGGGVRRRGGEAPGPEGRRRACRLRRRAAVRGPRRPAGPDGSPGTWSPVATLGEQPQRTPDLGQGSGRRRQREQHAPLPRLRHGRQGDRCGRGVAAGASRTDRWPQGVPGEYSAIRGAERARQGSDPRRGGVHRRSHSPRARIARPALPRGLRRIPRRIRTGPRPLRLGAVRGVGPEPGGHARRRRLGHPPGPRRDAALGVRRGARHQARLAEDARHPGVLPG